MAGAKLTGEVTIFLPVGLSACSSGECFMSSIAAGVGGWRESMGAIGRSILTSVGCCGCADACCCCKGGVTCRTGGGGPRDCRGV